MSNIQQHFTETQQALLNDLIAEYVQFEQANPEDALRLLGGIQDKESKLLEQGVSRSDITCFVDSYFAHDHARTQTVCDGEKQIAIRKKKIHQRSDPFVNTTQVNKSFPYARDLQSNNPDSSKRKKLNPSKRHPEQFLSTKR